MNRLLLDFGATSIKSVFQTNGTLINESFFSTHSSSVQYGDSFSSDLVVENFLKHVIAQYKICPFSEIWLCSEMHNFTAYEQRKHLFSDFYSWRHVTGKSLAIKDQINQRYPHLKVDTGQTLHAGMPVLNFSELNGLSNCYRLLTLPELIVQKLGNLSGKIDISMAASYGCYSLLKEEWELDLLEKIYPGLQIQLPSIFNLNEVPFLGDIKLEGKEIGVFGGYGDMQAALLGSSLDHKSVSINLGTGSQVAEQTMDIHSHDQFFDLKPFFGNFLSAITHIPAGRSLEYLNSKIFKDRDFWVNLNNITAESVLDFDKEIDFDLNILPNNWRYKENNLYLIKNSKLSTSDMYIALLKIFCNQYLDILDIFESDMAGKKIIISGGRLKNIPAVRDIFLGKFTNISIVEPETIDETLLGLNKISTRLNIRV